MIGTGINKSTRYKAQTLFGTPPGTTGAQVLRRVSAAGNLKKEAYESGELLSHYQTNDYRHGVKSADYPYQGELSPGTFKDFFAAAVRRAYAAVTAIAGASITIAGAGPTFTVTRSAGSFLTDGIKAGQVVKLTAGAFNAANLNKNLLVLSMTATVLTVMPLNGAALVAEGPIASATLSVPGKVTYAPAAGHTDNIFTFEDWHADLSLSERFDDCKLNQLDIQVPASGIITVGMQFLGSDMTPSGSQYFTSPSAETTTGLCASSTGRIVGGGSQLAIVTGLNCSIKGNMSGEACAGSDKYADITEGNIIVDGQMTVLFESATQRDWFINETEVALVAAMAVSPAAAADFVGLVLPRVKFGAADKDDGNKALVRTMPFRALFNAAGGVGTSSEQTSVAFQDSQA
jgi:hypothetical protein